MLTRSKHIKVTKSIFIRTKHNMRFFGVIHFIKLQHYQAKNNNNNNKNNLKQQQQQHLNQ